MGLNLSGDEFNKKTDEAFIGIPGVGKLIDDLLVQSSTLAELRVRGEEVLVKAREAGITLSSTKRQVGGTVRFGGYIISADDDGVVVVPDPGLLSAIKEFQEPTCMTELKRFLGLLNQLGDWCPDLSQHCVKMRTLLYKDTDWLFKPEIREENLRLQKPLLLAMKKTKSINEKQ